MTLQVAIGQINPVIGDVRGNAGKISETYNQAVNIGADLVLFPELALIGYPPQDLLHRNRILSACQSHLEELAANTNQVPMIVGYPHRESNDGRFLYNSAALLQNGEFSERIDKTRLPTYDVFDEHRYFCAGENVDTVDIQGYSTAITICEDLWPSSELPPGIRYDFSTAEELERKNPDLVINIAASPYWLGKEETRKNIFRRYAGELNSPVLYCNMVGANDELIFDGRSFVVNSSGEIQNIASAYSEDLLSVEVDSAGSEVKREVVSGEENAVEAISLGITDYVRKTGFERVTLGLSGGIDSSVTAAIATYALGQDRVLGVSMPSGITSSESKEDAKALADNLGIQFEEISIESLYREYTQILDPVLDGLEGTVAAENIQARIRGVLLMAISNHSGHLVLATGNKSELAVGYCTLYGDMVGGLAPLGDVPKTRVYDLGAYLNENTSIGHIPDRVFNKPPSAELKPDQTDQDVLPPYDELDRILVSFIEKELDPERISENTSSPATVRDVVARFHKNEFKRRQAPPVLKITDRAFGIGRHMPIAKNINL